MPNRDIKNNLQNDLAFYAAISTDTTTAGQILATAHFDGGIMWSFAALTWTDGVYTPLIEESDDPGMSGATIVPADRLIGTAAAVTAALGAATALGANLARLGIMWSKPFVRLSMVSTGTTSGATIAAIATKVPEEVPAA